MRSHGRILKVSSFPYRRVMVLSGIACFCAVCWAACAWAVKS